MARATFTCLDSLHITAFLSGPPSKHRHKENCDYQWQLHGRNIFYHTENFSDPIRAFLSGSQVNKDVRRIAITHGNCIKEKFLDTPKIFLTLSELPFQDPISKQRHGENCDYPLQLYEEKFFGPLVYFSVLNMIC